MKLALQLALVTGALVVGGAVHAAARAWATAPGLAVGVGVAGGLLGAALVALLLSRRAEDRDHLTSLLNAGAAVALGLAVERRLGPKLDAALAPGIVHGGLILLVATYLCARIALRRTDLSALPTAELIRATARSDRARLAASELLPARADALEVALTLASDEADPSIRVAATRVVGGLVGGAPPEARERAVALATKAIEAGGELASAGVSLASNLAHPDLIAPLRRARGDRDPWIVLDARARCGDLDVIDDLLAATDADRARDVARALGAALVPAVSGRLGGASDDEAARLLSLLGATRSSEAFDLAADRAGAGAPAKVRAAALRALADIDPRRAAPLARDALSADDLMVRTWAQSVLRAAGDGA